MLRLAVACCALVAARSAAADVTHKAASGATIDWSRGAVIVTGVGLADRHAPSPAVGRAAARRRAEDDARRQLAIALGELPWAPGAKPAELAARDGWLLAHAVVLAAELAPDGAWQVDLALPIEAIRAGLVGTRALPAGGDGEPPRALVIDARALTDLAPIGGVAIGAAGQAGATLWLDREPGSALVGGKPDTRKATGLADGVLAIDGKVPDLAGRLIVVVVRGSP